MIIVTIVVELLLLLNSFFSMLFNNRIHKSID